MLRLETHLCPIDDEALCRRIIGLTQWTFGGEDFSSQKVLRGDYADSSDVLLCLGFIEDELAGSTIGIIGMDYPGLGLIADVTTLPEYRGQGIAGQLCDAATEYFKMNHGNWLLLGTNEENARRIYERAGFAEHAGNVMIWNPAGADLSSAYWGTSTEEVRIRPAAWGDLPRLVMLYTCDLPWPVSHWQRELVSSAFTRQARAVSSAGPTWHLTVDGGGSWIVAENRDGAIVGAVTLTRGGTPLTQHAAVVDLAVHPAYASASDILLKTALDDARVRKITSLSAYLSSQHEDQRAVFTSAGFTQCGKIPGALKFEDQSVDVEIFHLARTS
jgi:GNAT superfamily N-acetyltransferase/L-amino acid N-acyltransferase YncA